MADAKKPDQPTESTDAQTEVKPSGSVGADAAEIESLLGTVRAAAGESERLQQAASKSASEAELARTKAREHSLEVDAKKSAAQSDADTIKSLASKSATQSAHIDEGVKYADEARAECDASRQVVVDLRSQIEESAQKAQEDLAAVSSLLNDLTERRAAIAPLRAEIEALRTTASEAATAAETAREDIASVRDAAKTRADEAEVSCKNVEDGKQYIEEQRATAEACAVNATTKLTDATNAATAAQDSLASIEEIGQDVNTVLVEIKQAAAEIQATKNDAEVDHVATAELAKIADSVQERVNEYEAELERLKGEYGRVHTKIETLLPDATSAGLASAFHKQRGEYARPRTWWNVLLLLALVGLAAIGGMETYRVLESLVADSKTAEVPEYDELLRSFLSRLPIIAAFVWLALHAASKARIANQIKEDYEFKEVVSRAFEGYKKEFGTLEQELPPDSPLDKLCTSMVSVIAAPPGRVYDKHTSDPTPMSSTAEVAKQVATAMKHEVKASIERSE